MDEDRSTAFRIAAVNPEDFEDWFNLALALWPEEEETDRQELRHTLTEILNADHQTGWIVRDASGAAIAFMNLSLRQDYVPGATKRPVAFVEGIYVHAPYRHQGVGTALIHWAEAWARQQGCAELASDALIENQGSYQFHTQVGFEEVERVVCFIKPLTNVQAAN
jgi:aminoglycoside 6'-N-acetyltransferase I